MRRGKFIAIYGINGIGKTTQVNLLVDNLKKQGKKVSRLKYPIYDLSPEGPFIYQYLRNPEFRKNNEISTHELQEKYAANRLRYEKELKERLEKGEWIIAEDYVGTGISWGLTWGGDLEFLEKINKELLREDLSILLHGNRFVSAIEKGHRNETEDGKIKICKNFLLLLSERYGWEVVEANDEIKKVQADLLEVIDNKFKK